MLLPSQSGMYRSHASPLSAAGWRCTAAPLPTEVPWDALAGYAEYGIHVAAQLCAPSTEVSQ